MRKSKDVSSNQSLVSCVTFALSLKAPTSTSVCVECRMRALPNAEGKYGCVQHPTAKTKEIYCLRIILRQDDLNMWVTAFADVAELITGVSVEEFHAFDDAGRKRIAWGVRGMKCNMTIGKTVGEMYTNYTVQSVEFAGYLP